MHVKNIFFFSFILLSAIILYEANWELVFERFSIIISSATSLFHQDKVLVKTQVLGE